MLQTITTAHMLSTWGGWRYNTSYLIFYVVFKHLFFFIDVNAGVLVFRFVLRHLKYESGARLFLIAVVVSPLSLQQSCIHLSTLRRHPHSYNAKQLPACMILNYYMLMSSKTLFVSSEANDSFPDILHHCINTPTIYFGHIYILQRHITWMMDNSFSNTLYLCTITDIFQNRLFSLCFAYAYWKRTSMYFLQPYIDSTLSH